MASITKSQSFSSAKSAQNFILLKISLLFSAEIFLFFNEFI
jgi:hypothetical protein